MKRNKQRSHRHHETIANSLSSCFVSDPQTKSGRIRWKKKGGVNTGEKRKGRKRKGKEMERKDLKTLKKQRKEHFGPLQNNESIFDALNVVLQHQST